MAEVLFFSKLSREKGYVQIKEETNLTCTKSRSILYSAYPHIKTLILIFNIQFVKLYTRTPIISESISIQIFYDLLFFHPDLFLTMPVVLVVKMNSKLAFSFSFHYGRNNKILNEYLGTDYQKPYLF